MIDSIGVWQVVAMDILNFNLGPTCPTLLRPETTVSGVTRQQGGRPAARVVRLAGRPTSGFLQIFEKASQF
jgi:hypothetical protein